MVSLKPGKHEHDLRMFKQTFYLVMHDFARHFFIHIKLCENNFNAGMKVEKRLIQRIGDMTDTKKISLFYI